MKKDYENIMKEDVIDRDELIEYLTWILENDEELEKFYDRENLRNNEDDIVPDVLGFRDWLKEQTFDNMIRDSYFEEYVKEYYEDEGEYEPEFWLQRNFIDWDKVCQYLLRHQYESIFDKEGEDHPYNIFNEDFYYYW